VKSFKAQEKRSADGRSGLTVTCAGVTKQIDQSTRDNQRISIDEVAR